MIHEPCIRRTPGGPLRAALPTILAILILALPAPSPAGAAEGPPPTRREEVRELIHGVEIVDPYRWLEAQESPETHAWIAAQNAYTQSLLADLPWRPAIRQRLAELMRVDRVEMPIQRPGRLFVWKTRAEDELPILYLRQGLTGRDEVLIDPHPLSADHTVSVTIVGISRDGKLLAYGVRDGGEDEVTIHFMDVDARRDLPDRLPRGIYTGVAFTADNRGFYYGRHDREIGDRIYYHPLGSDPAADVEIFGQGYGPDTWIGPELSDSGRYLLIGVYHGWTKVELYFRDLAAKGPIRPLVTDLDASFLPQFAGDRLVVLTDWQAPNRRLVAIDLERPQRDAWREIVPPGPDAIESFSLAGGRVFVHTLHNVTSQLKVFDLDGNARGEVALPGLGSASVPTGRWDDPTAFYDFRSFSTPRTIFRLDVATGRSSEWARDAVPFDPQDYEVRQVWYSSKDGTRVPMFLVHRRGLERNGRQPTALYGYGGFGVSVTPWFSMFAAPWIERGGLFAVANIRGGGEFGEAWHRAGMLEKKQNVFDDFIAAAEWLIDNRYTNPRKLAILGGSNGGLLMGAVMTQRPELFQAVLCLIPDLDMVRYHEFENNNPPALLEYGNAADPEQFKFLYAYSPYHRVRKGTEYPAVLLRTGHNDTRVPPLQARKMTALLQYATASERPILLHYDMRAGHAGGAPASTGIDNVTRYLSFLVWQLGMEPRGWEDASTAPLKARAPGFPPPAEPMELAVAGYAKVLCSAVFVSGRQPEEAVRNSAWITVPEAERPLGWAGASPLVIRGDRGGIKGSQVRWTVDREKQEVEASWYELRRRARFYGDQGCVILPRGGDGVFFTPVPVRTTLPDAATQPWAMGDRIDGEPLPPEVDAEALAAAVETAFADPEALTAAFLVVYRGRIIAERYELGVDKDTQLESWSMGKSLTATLVGLLVQDGTLDLDQPAPVAAWQSADDPRSAIRGIDLLQMSGGLHFVAPQDPDYSPALGYPDHMYIYTGAVDVFEYAISRPLQFPPGTEGRYRNSDPLVLGYLVREAVRARGEEYLTFPQRALFDRIGIRRQVLETDPWGNFVLTGYDYGTARGWARLGLLYLQDGTWQGERLLPEGWAELVSTPAPGWDEPIYGGLFWLLRSGVVLPADAYFMAGAGGQRTIIVPSLDLVIVRMGHQRGNQRGMELLDQALAQLVDAIDFENRAPRGR